MIIKAQRYRGLERNLADALLRLRELVDSAAAVPRKRKATRRPKAPSAVASTAR